MPFRNDSGPSFFKPRKPSVPNYGAPKPPPVVPTVPTAPAPAPPPGYGDLLSQLLAGFGSGMSGGLDPASAKAMAERALVQYGNVPGGLSGLSNLGGAFGNDTAALAKQNTASGLSILARLGQAHTDNLRYIKNTLTAHGILGSGETGFRTGREQTSYAGSQADASQKLLDYLSGLNSGVAQYLQYQALMDALRNAAAGGGGGGGGTPPGEVPPPSGGDGWTPWQWQSGHEGDQGWLDQHYRDYVKQHGYVAY